MPRWHVNNSSNCEHWWWKLKLITQIHWRTNRISKLRFKSIWLTSNGVLPFNLILAKCLPDWRQNRKLQSNFWQTYFIQWYTDDFSYVRYLILDDDLHEDFITWKRLPRYLPFARGIHRSPVDSPYKGQVARTFDVSLISAWINYSIVWWFETPRRSCDVIIITRNISQGYKIPIFS